MKSSKVLNTSDLASMCMVVFAFGDVANSSWLGIARKKVLGHQHLNLWELLPGSPQVI